MTSSIVQPKAGKFSVKEHSRNVHEIAFAFPKVGMEQWCLLISDVHFDSTLCDRNLLKKHLDMAKERNAFVLDNGDFFDAMQGKFDKRSTKAELRPEYTSKERPYLEHILVDAAKFLEPYGPNLAVFGMGNHETGVLGRHEFNLTQSLVERLKQGGAPNVHMGGYTGFIKFSVFCGTTQKSIRLHYDHGAGGGSPVTKGVIQTARRAAYISDCDICWYAHTHNSWIVDIARIRLNIHNQVEHLRQTHVKSPGYKNAYADGWGGWDVERGHNPKTLGGMWIRFYSPSHKQVEMDFIMTR